MAFKTDTPQDRFVAAGLEIAQAAGGLSALEALNVLGSTLGMLSLPGKSAAPATAPDKKPKKPKRPKPKYEEQPAPAKEPKPERAKPIQVKKIINRDENGKQITMLDAIKAAVEVGAEVSPKEVAELLMSNGFKTASRNVPQMAAVTLNKAKTEFEQIKRGVYKRVA